MSLSFDAASPRQEEPTSGAALSHPPRGGKLHRIIGDMSNRERVLLGLDLIHGSDNAE